MLGDYIDPLTTKSIMRRVYLYIVLLEEWIALCRSSGLPVYYFHEAKGFA